jgi:glycosyltransferase involved in cell wall biosynthesis
VNVLYVIDSLGRGGSEQSLVELIAALKPLGVSATVFRLASTRGVLEPELEALGVSVKSPSGAGKLRRIRDLRREIRATKPDLLHTSIFGSDQAGRIAAWRTGTPVVTSLVNTFDDPSRRSDPAITPWKLRVASTIDGWTARHLTDHFHAVSKRVARSATSALRVPASRVTVIERGRDESRLGQRTDERRQRVRAALDLSATAEVVIAIGRQEHQKGQRFLLEAFDRVVAARPHAVLLIAGREGASTRELEAARRRSPAAERIRFLGERSDVPDLLVAADVFALSSLYEGLPGALIEAMALELPIVATAIEPVRELVEHETSALLVPASDSAGLGDALVRVLGDRDLARRMTAHARATFVERGSVERSATEMLELYRRIASV